MSTFQPGRTFLDWPDDVEAAADRLGLDRFAVLGASGGSPYAVACAVRLQDRVTRVGIVVGAGPIEAPGMRESPSIAGVPDNALVRKLEYAATALSVRTRLRRRFVSSALREMSAPDQAMLALDDVREWFLSVAREALVGAGRGAAYEAGMYRQPWGFDLSRVAPETHLWYARADRNVPASVGEWLAHQIPTSRLVVWPHHGHYTWAMDDEAADVVGVTAGAPAQG